jgi:hypothetical protein
MHSKSNKILFVFEGEKTEKQISKSLTKNLSEHFINENTIVECVFCADIYHLHKQISTDEFLDTFTLLKEIPQNKNILSPYNSSDFSEIYMFFDYDGHATLASDEKIKSLLKLFKEETEFGKIFISYPMVEALKHYSEAIHFKELKVKSKENIKYKQKVNQETKNNLKQFSKYTMQTWSFLIDLHLKKINFIVFNDFSIPQKHITQLDIFKNQLEKYINIDSTVAVISAFPIFLFDYYGYIAINNLISQHQ